MKENWVDNLFVLGVFLAEGAVLGLVGLVMIYILFPRLRKEIKEDFSRKVKW